MSVGPAEILIILVVGLLVFGPQRLPEVGRQVGAALRELRKMQDTVRGELDQVLHPEHGTRSSSTPAYEPDDHSGVDSSAFPTPADDPDATPTDFGPSDMAASDMSPPDMHPPDMSAADATPIDTGDVTSVAIESTEAEPARDRGFAGPSDSFI
jgi:Tat protein translocase TatB subunit